MKKLYTIILLALVGTYTNAQGIWTQKADFGGGPRIYAVSFSIGTNGYIGTGEFFGPPSYNDFWEWDQATNVWTQKANYPNAVYGAVGFSIGTKGYVGTGSSSSGGLLNDFWEYDPSLNTWTQKANFGGTGRDEAVGFSIGNKGYIGTGEDGSGLPNDFWEYDPTLDTWTQKTNFGGVGRYEAVGFSIGNKGYIGTGHTQTTPFNDFWEYDPSLDTWTQKANFGGLARCRAVGFSIGTNGYIGTGQSYGPTTNYLDFWAWDQSTNTWTQQANYIGGRKFIAVGFSIGTKGYIGTGFDSTNNSAKNFWELNTACGTAAAPLCMVTTDSTTNYVYNVICWDKTSYSNVDSFIVYRKDAISSNYLRIGAVNKSALSEFVDTAFSIGGPNGGNPQYSSWFYKLAIRDTCGNVNVKGPYHQSMFVQKSGANFSWNAYTIESGQTNPVTGYSFLRDDNNTGNWHVLVNTVGISTTDPNYSSYPNANWRIDAIGFNCTPTMKLANTQNTYLKAHSNTTKVVAAGINQLTLNNEQVTIYPNPTSGVFQIHVAGGKGSGSQYKIEIYNVFGELVYSTQSTQSLINLSEKPNGIYFLQLNNNEFSKSEKLIIIK